MVPGEQGRCTDRPRPKKKFRSGMNHDSSIVTLDSLLLDKVKGKSSYFFDRLEMA